MPPVTPADGPVAVTGASGYIGSYIVLTCVKSGYEVRACVRDPSKPAKCDHLLAMNNAGHAGSVSLVRADLFEPGSYDAAFKGCSAVIHAGAAVGYNKESPQQVYDGCFKSTVDVIESVKKSGTVKRIICTSSFAAVGHPEQGGYVYSEKDWCDQKIEDYGPKWVDAGRSVWARQMVKENIPKSRDVAYALGKAEGERVAEKMAAEDGRFDAMSICPIHVIGPLMCANHKQPWSWQDCIGQMLEGKPYQKAKGGRMLWNCVDVRDTAEMHRLAMESPVSKNGARYIAGATDRSYELFTHQLQAKLKQLFPRVAVGGEHGEPGKAYDAPRAYCHLAREELGLKPHPIDDTLKANGDSLVQLGLIKLATQAAL